MLPGVINWHKQHEGMDPCCLVLPVQASGGGVVVCEVFLAHFGSKYTKGFLVYLEYSIV